MKRVLPAVCFAAVCLGQQSKPAVARWEVTAAAQTSEGHIYHLRGHAELRGAEGVFRADEIDYDEDKAVVHLAGHVTIETDTVSVRADDVDYDVNSGEIQSHRGDVKVKLKPAPAR